MLQYLVSALDYTDENALDRRMATRTLHLETVKKLKESGNFILGGAVLNPDGKMIGSTLILQFEKETNLQEWLRQEPYMLQKVWEKVDIKPFKVAQI